MHQHSANGKNIFGIFGVAAFLLLVVSSLLWAKPGVIHTKDGRTLEGEVNDTESSDVVVITIHGVQTSIARDDIEKIDYPQSIEQDYNQRAAQIGASDVQGHLDLARWLMDKKAYALAIHEVFAAQKIDPANGEAATLYQTIVLQERLATVHAAPAKVPATGASAPPAATPGTPATPGTEAHDAPVRKYLSPDDINAIRQCEWKSPDDITVHVRLEGDVGNRFVAMTGVSKADFNNQKDEQKGWQILQKGAPALAKDVKILSGPASLEDYRRKVQPAVLAGCATSNCHGGSSVHGKFFLYAPAPADNDPVTFTNFYILATSGTKAGRLIDRTSPNKSLLLQYALPATVADTAHANSAKAPWKGIFTGKDDPRYKAMASWINDSLVATEPTYNVNFVLIKEVSPATQPATQPSTLPATQPGPEGAPDAAPAPAPDSAPPAPLPEPPAVAPNP
jgi:hypothetical protein